MRETLDTVCVGYAWSDCSLPNLIAYAALVIPELDQ